MNWAEAIEIKEVDRIEQIFVRLDHWINQQLKALLSKINISLHAEYSSK